MNLTKNLTKNLAKNLAKNLTGMYRLCLTMSLTLYLAACTLTPERPTKAVLMAAWQARVQQLQGQVHWRLLGRAALRHEHEAAQAQLRWYQDGDEYRIHFVDPLGRQLAELQRDSAGVSYREGQSPPLMASTAEALLAQELGWDLPVSGLRYWLLGIPAPGPAETHLRLDALGRAKWLEQTGWRVEYPRYASADPLAIPSRVRLTRAHLQVTLVIDKWQPTVP